jgi:hypothetical protein
LETQEPSQNLLIDTGKPRKTCVEVAGRRIEVAGRRIEVAGRRKEVAGRMFEINRKKGKSCMKFSKI